MSRKRQRTNDGGDEMNDDKGVEVEVIGRRQTAMGWEVLVRSPDSIQISNEEMAEWIIQGYTVNRHQRMPDGTNNVAWANSWISLDYVGLRDDVFMNIPEF